jgi:hypothetical protein
VHFGPVQARRVNFEASFRSRGRDVGCEGGDAEVYNEVGELFFESFGELE